MPALWNVPINDRLNELALTIATLAGLAWIGVGLARDGTLAAEPAHLVWLLGLGSALLAAVVRNVHLRRSAPYCRLSQDGISLRYCEPLGFSTWIGFPVFVGFQEDFIPWTDLRRGTADVRVLNGIVTYDELELQVEGREPIYVEAGLFEVSGHAAGLRQQIDDYRKRVVAELSGTGPAAPAADPSPARNALLLATGSQLEIGSKKYFKPRVVLLMLGVAGVGALVALILLQFDPRTREHPLVGLLATLAILSVMVGFSVACYMLAKQSLAALLLGSKRLECDQDGIRLCSGSTTDWSAAWQTVACATFVRNQTAGVFGTKPREEPSFIELLLQDGSKLKITDSFELPIEAIYQVLLDGPVAHGERELRVSG